MTSKTISVDEEAYERLVAEKRESESFSDVVKRLAGERSWLEVAGLCSEDISTDIEDVVERRRDQTRQRRSAVVAALEGDDPELRESEQ